MKIAQKQKSLVCILAMTLAVWCAGSASANPGKSRTANLTPSNPHDLWIVMLNPAEDANYEVKIAKNGKVNNVDYVFESSDVEPPWFTKPFFIWVGGGSDLYYSFHVANAEWIAAETTVKVTCRWVPVGGGQGPGGGGGPGPIDGSALGDAYAYQAAFIIEAAEQPPIIAVGDICEVQAFLVDENGARKPAEADWTLGGTGEIEGEQENVDYVLVLRDEPGELPVHAVCCKAPELSDDEILTYFDAVLIPYPWLIAAETAWGEISDEMQRSNISVSIMPSELTSLVLPQLALVLEAIEENPEYETGTGTLEPDPVEAGKWIYTPFEELITSKHPLIKRARLRLTYKEQPIGCNYWITIYPVFYYLVMEDERTLAWQYSRWKYDIDITELTSITYNPNLSHRGETDKRMSGENYCEIGPDAFDDENICASTLGHENKHGEQPYGFYTVYRSCAETEAYFWELLNASHTGISQWWINRIWENYYQYSANCTQ